MLIRVLGSTAVLDGAAVLLKIAQDPGESLEARRAAITGLGRFGDRSHRTAFDRLAHALLVPVRDPDLRAVLDLR